MTVRQVGRSDQQRTLTVLSQRDIGKGLPEFSALTPGDAAGFRAAENFRWPLPETFMQALCGLDRQCAAGGKHPAYGAQGRPVEVVAHALEQRRAGHPGEGRVFAAGALQVFRKGQLPTQERAPGAQWPKHPKQQAVDVLGGDAANDARRAQVGAPQLFQGFDFIGQLAQVFFDALGFAAGAGCAQAESAVIQVQRGGTKRRLLEVAKVRIVGLIAQPQINIT
ncbi:hypothetical protein D3C71_1031050 [compost metagenome]